MTIKNCKICWKEFNDHGKKNLKCCSHACKWKSYQALKIWDKIWLLTVIWTEREWKRYLYKCECVCWNIVSRWSYRLKTIWDKSSCRECTYKRKREEKHIFDKKFSQTYNRIKNRCTCKSYPWYHRYWWRWIKNERETYEEFYNDMYESYKEHVEKYWKKETSIDRIDVNWNYCKENCRRATNKEQANNRGNTLYIEYNWEKYSVHELADMLWIKPSYFYNRMQWKHSQKKKWEFKFHWQIKTLKERARLLWVTRWVMEYRWLKDKEQWLPFEHSIQTIMEKRWIKEIKI